ncbi:BrnT family toxin [Candidatus Deferrimicrobium sp.]|uniref:BrnT family toxin n=1 Tax=Candidatus Deferrimicrobium sp. TaxID=3060586 RepID=UPI00271B372E|nr:BrnT family toxin [Candidatus Deferrimicrobium sp.]MDO8737912.1 BrnT family toxin [Candidatus Deferrimicrobium sp.]
MGLIFTWDKKKATFNLRKHDIAFEEAATAFGDTLSLTTFDPDHSSDEDRFILLGASNRGRLLVVAHTEQSDTIRIINARLATRGERNIYEES